MKTKIYRAQDVEVGDDVVIYSTRYAFAGMIEKESSKVQRVASKAIGSYTGNIYFGFENGFLAEDIHPNDDIEVVIEP